MAGLSVLSLLMAGLTVLKRLTTGIIVLTLLMAEFSASIRLKAGSSQILGSKVQPDDPISHIVGITL
jgi:hypothetical protein